MCDRLIYLVRPGQVQLAEAPKRYIGQWDLPLNSIGIRQAHAVGRVLKYVRPTLIVGSDLTRGRQTAEIIAHYHPGRLQISKDLREVDLGEWAGLIQAEVRQRFPAEFEKCSRDPAAYRPPGGESFLECRQRVVAALEEIVGTTQGRILIVGHLGVNRAILGHLLGLSLDELLQLDQEQGCYSVVRADGAGHRLVIFNRVPGNKRAALST